MICRYCNGTGTSNTCVNGTFKSCAACNGTGEEIEEKITNFDRITASPEALATFVYEAENMCERCVIGDISCNDCECQWCGLAGRKDLIDWLNEESKE